MVELKTQREREAAQFKERMDSHKRRQLNLRVEQAVDLSFLDQEVGPYNYTWL